MQWSSNDQVGSGQAMDRQWSNNWHVVVRQWAGSD